MIPELIKFLKENKDLINENTKKSWEEIYKKLESKGSIGEFTNTILKAEINDPAEILGYIPKYYLYKSNIQDYKIPDNVKNIGDYAFYDCNNLVSVKIGDNVTTIG